MQSSCTETARSSFRCVVLQSLLCYIKTKHFYQVDALLPMVRPKQTRKAPLERFLLHLHEHIMSLPELKPIHPLRGAEMLASSPFGRLGRNRGSSKPRFTPVAVPYCHPLPAETTNWKVAFAAPAEITLVGSWATETAVKGRDDAPFGVDIALEMPSVCCIPCLYHDLVPTLFSRLSSKRRTT